MYRTTRKLRGILAALTLMAGVSTAQAIPIVDTGPSPFVGSAHPGISLFGNSFESQFVAGRFTTTETYEITGLSAFVRGYACCGTISYSFNLGLATGPANADGATFSNLFALPTSFTSVNSSADWAGVAVDNYLLSPGTYWIVASVSSGPPGLGMPGGVPDPLDAYAFFSSELGHWQSLGESLGGTFIPAKFGFRIEGNPVSVPEPGSLSVMLLGLGGVLLLGIRRRSVAITRPMPPRQRPSRP
jgi:hypothetical protein